MPAPAGDRAKAVLHGSLCSSIAARYKPAGQIAFFSEIGRRIWSIIVNIDDVISRATHATGRTVSGFGAAVCLFIHFDGNLMDIQLLKSVGITLPMVSFAIPVLLGYLMGMHYLNWCNDWKTFNAGEFFTIFNREKEKVGVVTDNTPERKNLEDFKKEYIDQVTIASKAQKFSFWVQHLILPGLLGCLAIIVSLYNLGFTLAPDPATPSLLKAVGGLICGLGG